MSEGVFTALLNELDFVEKGSLREILSDESESAFLIARNPSPIGLRPALSERGVDVVAHFGHAPLFQRICTDASLGGELMVVSHMVN